MALVKAIKGGPEAVKQYFKKLGAEETKKELARHMHSLGKSPEEIAFLLMLSLDEVEKYLEADEA